MFFLNSPSWRWRRSVPRRSRRQVSSTDESLSVKERRGGSPAGPGGPPGFDEHRAGRRQDDGREPAGRTHASSPVDGGTPKRYPAPRIVWMIRGPWASSCAAIPSRGLPACCSGRQSPHPKHAHRCVSSREPGPDGAGRRTARPVPSRTGSPPGACGPRNAEALAASTAIRRLAAGGCRVDSEDQTKFPFMKDLDWLPNRATLVV